jgi:hypothetical protein
MAAALVLGGCASSPSVAGAGSMAGRWVSTLSSEFVELELRGTAAGVAGRAVLMPGGTRTAYAVDGAVRGGDVAATLRTTAPGGAVSLRGTLRGDTLTVRLDSGGFRDRAVPLVRG